MRWYQVGVKYTKEFQDGTLKRVSEPFIIQAESFTDAEATIYKEVGEFIRGEFIVDSIVGQNFADVLKFDDSEIWHKVKTSYTTEDDNGKDKKVNNLFLVSAPNVDEASKRVMDLVKPMIHTVEISKIEKTKIVDVIPVKQEEYANQ